MPSKKKMLGIRPDPMLLVVFRNKCQTEGRTMNAVVERLMEIWVKGGISLDKSKKKA
jgi:hypothetical protein